MREKARSYFIIPGLVIIPCLFIYLAKDDNTGTDFFIKGINLEAPPRPFDSTALKRVKETHADWISVIPYAFTSTDNCQVYFDGKRQWWGEKSEGVIACIEMARQLGLKVMIKPHLWVKGQGWAGDFVPDDEKKWSTWETSYEKYILNYAKIASKYGVPMLCIGTECRKAAVARPVFWKNLIASIRRVYQGKLTYAANWDNYKNITFWDQLDFIGIDAYFPLSDQKTPSVSQLNSRWKEPHRDIREFSLRLNKPVIFTEYGYKSTDYPTIGHWKVNADTISTNLDGQVNAYESIYQTFWNEPWFKGGFLWKWHLFDERIKPNDNPGFTPQGKPAMQVIKKWFKGSRRKNIRGATGS